MLQILETSRKNLHRFGCEVVGIYLNNPITKVKVFELVCDVGQCLYVLILHIIERYIKRLEIY